MNIDEFKTLLKFDGVNLDDYSDEELEVLLKAKLKELEGLIGADITPQEHVSNNNNFYGNVYELDFYPIVQVVCIRINGKPLKKHEYHVDYEHGLIYFNKTIPKVHHHYYYRQVHYYPYHHHHHHHRGAEVNIQYLSGISYKDYEFLILPLIKDMMAYNIAYATANKTLNGMAGFVNSLHEGDTSMNFGNLNSGGGNSNYGYSPGINSRIDELVKKYKYNARVKYL